jgi:hypothetical protein
MTNEERKAALNKARKKALEHALKAETTQGIHSEESVTKSEMWALVAQAMKDGDPHHDGPDGRPDSLDTLTR